MEKSISYLNKTYSDYKDALIAYSKKYYPELTTNFDDASVGAWMIDLNAEIGDNLSYYIDRAFQETNINSASETASVYSLARNNGFKIPGPKGAMVEVKFSCYIPVIDDNSSQMPNWDYAPIIKRGTIVSSSNQSFELLNDIDFSEQFSDEGISDREILPVRDSNGYITQYLISKFAVVVAGETKIYKKQLFDNDIYPFMEIVIPAKNVMNVESIIVKDGSMLTDYPTYGEFYMINETSEQYSANTRFFEVDYLAQQERWGDIEENGRALKYEFSYTSGGTQIPTYSVTKGEWKPLYHKFMTEYTDKGYLKVIFGAGVDPANEVDISEARDFSRYQISKVIKNNCLGVLPQSNKMLYILYRVGGGVVSNLAKGAVNSISTLRVEIPCNDASRNSGMREKVRRSITVLSTTPSVSGKDMPSAQEIKYMTKYNSGAQERCVTTKDYIDRILKLPPRYGTPFRVGVSEENNKIMIYLLGIDYNGHLDSNIPVTLCENIQDYLSEYRMINDFVEIKSGRIVNVAFDVVVKIDENYNAADVKTEVIKVITDYMDVNKRNMGDDVYVGDIEKEISKVDGVVNLISLDVYNKLGIGYSNTVIQQELASIDECKNTTEREKYLSGTSYKVDLSKSRKTLISDGDTMLEIKYPSQDISVTNAK